MVTISRSNLLTRTIRKHSYHDIHTAAKLYGYTEDTAIYGDATFFVTADKNLMML